MTDQGISPWYVVEAVDHRYRDITVGNVLLDAMKQKLEHSSLNKGKPKAAPQTIVAKMPNRLTVLNKVDLTRTIPQNSYEKQLEKYQELFKTVYHRRI
jgi:polyphosphate kinase 2 (PPK2 family)